MAASAYCSCGRLVYLALIANTIISYCEHCDGFLRQDDLPRNHQDGVLECPFCDWTTPERNIVDHCLAEHPGTFDSSFYPRNTTAREEG